ncbi:uncharacterized protein LOC142996804 [Genypterus blacodes]|uniref:uncharacterized protein LOC142996804 n=1 Tax=Genypterus blacodes TaxID=154954 RepID=UPI003F75B2A0
MASRNENDTILPDRTGPQKLYEETTLEMQEADSCKMQEHEEHEHMELMEQEEAYLDEMTNISRLMTSIQYFLGSMRSQLPLYQDLVSAEKGLCKQDADSEIQQLGFLDLVKENEDLIERNRRLTKVIDKITFSHVNNQRNIKTLMSSVHASQKRVMELKQVTQDKDNHIQQIYVAIQLKDNNHEKLLDDIKILQQSDRDMLAHIKSQEEDTLLRYREQFEAASALLELAGTEEESESESESFYKSESDSESENITVAAIAPKVQEISFCSKVLQAAGRISLMVSIGVGTLTTTTLTSLVAAAVLSHFVVYTGHLMPPPY